MTQQPKKLLDQVRDAIRLKHYAYSTEKTYVYWAKRFVLYHNKRHPLEMGEKEISANGSSGNGTWACLTPHFRCGKAAPAPLAPPLPTPVLPSTGSSQHPPPSTGSSGR